MIKEFTNEYRFLSNFHISEVRFEGVKYPTIEHAFQAAKTLDKEERKMIGIETTPGRAKRAGQRVTLREDWDKVKISIMLDLIRQKFKNDYILKNKLLATGNQMLVEGNTWNDTFWGMDLKTNRGQNNLGKLLTKVREECMLV